MTEHPTSDSVTYVYIVRCADDTLYTGWTVDLQRRVREHNAGRGARYTRQHGPVDLVYWLASVERRLGDLALLLSLGLSRLELMAILLMEA